jgi:cytoskeleton protein RodZ
MADSEQPSPPAAPPPAATLGELLRTARLSQDLTVEQLSTELRIEAKQLNALEDNRFEQIGVPVFIKGYLKQYGSRLGLNVADLLALYYKQTTLAEIEVRPNRAIKLRDERQVTSWVFAAIVLLVVVAGLAAWWWNGGSFGTMLPPRGAETTPVAAPPPAETSPPPQARRFAPVAAPAPAISNAATLPIEPAAAVEAVAVPTAAEAAEQPADDDAAAAAATGAAIAAIALELSFQEESWAEITDARGERLLFGLSAAGRVATVRGEPPFAVVLGNADAVRLTVDGEPFEIPLVGRDGNLARFTVDVAEE